MNASFEQTLIDVWRQALVENADVVKLGWKTLSGSHHSPERLAAGGLRFWRERNSWAGAEPGYEITLGAVGTVWQKSDAVLERRTVRGECRGWEGNFVRQMKRDESVRISHCPIP
jgi:hypothetical protein